MRNGGRRSAGTTASLSSTGSLSPGEVRIPRYCSFERRVLIFFLDTVEEMRRARKEEARISVQELKERYHIEIASDDATVFEPHPTAFDRTRRFQDTSRKSFLSKRECDDNYCNFVSCIVHFLDRMLVNGPQLGEEAEYRELLLQIRQIAKGFLWSPLPNSDILIREEDLTSDDHLNLRYLLSHAFLYQNSEPLCL